MNPRVEEPGALQLGLVSTELARRVAVAFDVAHSDAEPQSIVVPGDAPWAVPVAAYGFGDYRPPRREAVNESAWQLSTRWPKHAEGAE